jgi:hypothetical protein
MMPAKALTSILHINSVADGRRRFNARPHAFVSIAIVAPAGSAAQVTVVTRPFHVLTLSFECCSNYR